MRNKRKKEGIMPLVMAFAMSLAMLSGVATNTLQAKAAATVSNPRIAEDGTVTWDKITFGSYPQDATFEAEPIKWRILDIDSQGNAFLLADKAIDRKPYNTEYADCTWETCTLRDWLNGTGDYMDDDSAFINAAFTDEEKEAIVSTNVENSNNPSYSTAGGNNTNDKIYLLSIAEASNIAYGFDSEFGTSRITRQVNVTDYAKFSGANVSESDNCNWWLRSPGRFPDGAAYVKNDTWSYFSGDYGNEEYNAVRPALHINLSSNYVTDAGKVTTDGVVTQGTNSIKSSSEYSKPSISDGVTTWDCVYFGNYKQNVSYEKKPIEWRVLSINGNDAFVVADKALDCKPYNKQSEEKTDREEQTYSAYSFTWETCTLRDWLNGTDDYMDDDSAFINAAFTDEEKEAIVSTNVENPNNPSYSTAGGNSTNDKIYLMAVEEISNASYGFDAEFDTESEIRQVKPTDYVKINGAYVNESGNCNWWLRSPGYNNDFVAGVNYYGWGDYYGYDIYDVDTAVRPALHVDLSSSYVNSSGAISSNGVVVTDEEIEAQKEAYVVITLISAIGTVTKDSKTAIDSARSVYDALSQTAKNKVSNYSVLQAAESKYAELTKSGSNDNGNREENNGNGGSNNNGNASGTTDGNTNNTSGGSVGSNTGINPATTEPPVATEKGDTPTITVTPKDALTTFNIKNKKTYKKSKKIIIKDMDGIKSFVLNTKKIKIKKGKKSVSFKLSSYKKILKKKNKWNKIIVTDVNGNKRTIQFKTK